MNIFVCFFLTDSTILNKILILTGIVNIFSLDDPSNAYHTTQVLSVNSRCFLE